MDQSTEDLPRLVEKMEYEDRKNLVKKENPFLIKKYARSGTEAMEEEVTRSGDAMKRVERTVCGNGKSNQKSCDNILTSRKVAEDALVLLYKHLGL